MSTVLHFTSYGVHYLCTSYHCYTPERDDLDKLYKFENYRQVTRKPSLEEARLLYDLTPVNSGLCGSYHTKPEPLEEIVTESLPDEISEKVQVLLNEQDIHHHKKWWNGMTDLEKSEVHRIYRDGTVFKDGTLVDFCNNTVMQLALYNEANRYHKMHYPGTNL